MDSYPYEFKNTKMPPAPDKEPNTAMENIAVMLLALLLLGIAFMPIAISAVCLSIAYRMFTH